MAIIEYCLLLDEIKLVTQHNNTKQTESQLQLDLGYEKLVIVTVVYRNIVSPTRLPLSFMPKRAEITICTHVGVRSLFGSRRRQTTLWFNQFYDNSKGVMYFQIIAHSYLQYYHDIGQSSQCCHFKLKILIKIQTKFDAPLQFRFVVGRMSVAIINNLNIRCRSLKTTILHQTYLEG